MPEHVKQSYEDGDVKSLNSDNSYESVWLAHWMRTSSNSKSWIQNYSELSNEKKEDNNTNHGIMVVKSVDRRKSAIIDIGVGPSNVSRPLLCDHPRSSSSFVACKYMSEATQSRSFLYVKEEKEQAVYADTNFTPLEQENCSYCSSPTLWVSRGEGSPQDDTQNFGKSSSNHKNCTRIINDPSSTNFDFSLSIDGKGKSIKCLKNTGISSSCNNHGAHLLQRMPTCAVHDVERLKRCLTLDSVEGVLGGFSKFSQATHRLFITEKGSVDLTRGNQTYGKSKLFKEFTGNTLPDMFNLPSHHHDTRGPKLQLIGSSSSSERKEDNEDAETQCLQIKNGLSVETDTKALDDSDTRNSSQGIASSPSNKEFVVGENRAMIKVGSKRTEMSIPDINYDSSTIIPVKNLTGNRDASSQRTMSLVKRLKLSSSGEKVDNFFGKIMSYSIRSSEPTSTEHLGKKHVESDKSIVLFKNWQSTSKDFMKEDKDFTLSHPWIQRWCRNQAMKKPAAPVTCEPQVSKPSKKKKFLPSVGAMALMGKATNSFRPCEFRRRGPVVVWNTEKV